MKKYTGILIIALFIALFSAAPIYAQTPDSASTTPLLPGQIPNGDALNPEAEIIFNTVITPNTQPATTTEATTTPVASTIVQPSTPVTPTPVKPKPVSTPVSTPVDQPVLETFERTTDGTSNSILPSDYYIPLDNLTPQSTYALSFIAMILGIMGTVLILKEPSESPAWMPGLKTQESLLDS